MRGVVVEISAQRFGIPFECTCCGAPPTSEVRVGERALLFPYCTRCVTHVQAWDRAGIASAFAMVITIVAAAVAAFTAGMLAALAVFVVGASAAWFVRMSRHKAATAQRGASCSATGIAITAHGPTSFTFESPTFAARFAEENKAQLANPSAQLQRLLDGYHRARLAVPTPAVATGTAPPPMDARGWLARLESTEGTLARRVQLGRALEMIEEAHQRRELVQLVARRELAPILDRVARESTTAGKRQLLESALARVRNDNLSEELQAAEAKELEARLAELR